MSLAILIALLLVSSLLFLGPTQRVEAGLLQDAERALFVNFMVDYSTKEKSGYWRGWNYSNDKVQHNPETLKSSGNRDIASCYYPAIGPYDMTDPRVAEYHCQLLKMTGIDGVVFTLGFFEDPNAGNSRQRSYHRDVMRVYIRAMKEYGLKGVLLFEDKAHWLWNSKLTNRPDTVRAAFRDLENWLEVFKDVQYTIAGRPLVMLFSYAQEIPGRGESRFMPQELLKWRGNIIEEERPVFIAQWYAESYNGALEGYYEWPHITGRSPQGLAYKRYNDLEKEMEIWDSKHQEMYVNIANGSYQFVVGGVWPGFEDTGCFGWGGGCRVIPRFDGKVYAYHWKRMAQSDYPVVQVATWNDWCEGSVIEPTKEFGNQYLELTRAYASVWSRNPVVQGNLNVPRWIYKIRTEVKDHKALKAADKAAAAIASGKFSKAEDLLQPYLKKYRLE